MIAIEKVNATLKGVLSKNYARPEIDKTKLGELSPVEKHFLASWDKATKQLKKEK